jgi:hypothetical protein
MDDAMRGTHGAAQRARVVGGDDAADLLAARGDEADHDACGMGECSGMDGGLEMVELCVDQRAWERVEVEGV